MSRNSIPAGVVVAQAKLLARAARATLDAGKVADPAVLRDLETVAAFGQDVVELPPGPVAPRMAYTEAERKKGNALVSKLLATTAASRQAGAGLDFRFSLDLSRGQPEGTWQGPSHLVSDLARNKTVYLTVRSLGADAPAENLEVRGLDGLFAIADKYRV